MSRTRIWLPLESITIPSVSGRLVSAVKYFTICSLPSSEISKSSLVRLGMSAPCLSFTLKKSCTTLTFTFRVSVGCWDSSDFCSDFSFGDAGCWLGADCWEGDCWATINGATRHTTAKTAIRRKTRDLGIQDSRGSFVSVSLNPLMHQMGRVGHLTGGKCFFRGHFLLAFFRRQGNGWRRRTVAELG